MTGVVVSADEEREGCVFLPRGAHSGPAETTEDSRGWHRRWRLRFDGGVVEENVRIYLKIEAGWFDGLC